MNMDKYFTDKQLQYYQEKYPDILCMKSINRNDQSEDHKMQIEDFKLNEVIGQGSFGEVYSALDSSKGRPVAVKTVPITAFGNHSTTQERKINAMRHEIELLESLHHENIVNYLGTGKDEKNLYVFLEYVSGGTLVNVYKTHQLNEKLIAIYTK